MEPDRVPEWSALPRARAQPVAGNYPRRRLGDSNRRVRAEPREGPEAGTIADLLRSGCCGRRAGRGCQHDAGSRGRDASSAHSRDSDVGGVPIVAPVMVALVSVLLVVEPRVVVARGVALAREEVGEVVLRALAVVEPGVAELVMVVVRGSEEVVAEVRVVEVVERRRRVDPVSAACSRGSSACRSSCRRPGPTPSSRSR